MNSRYERREACVSLTCDRRGRHQWLGDDAELFEELEDPPLDIVADRADVLGALAGVAEIFAAGRPAR